MLFYLIFIKLPFLEGHNYKNTPHPLYKRMILPWCYQSMERKKQLFFNPASLIQHIVHLCLLFFPFQHELRLLCTILYIKSVMILIYLNFIKITNPQLWAPTVMITLYTIFMEFSIWKKIKFLKHWMHPYSHSCKEENISAVSNESLEYFFLHNKFLM